jgi:predicted GNAT family acetyltransferase
MKLKFQRAKSENEIRSVVDYNIDAFSDSPDFKWTFDEVTNEVAEGWELYSVALNNEIIAAVFYKIDGTKLLTKNTAIKVDHQGSGHSHKIKEFFEKVAREKHLKEIVHYCRIDNFRMYSLNESHSYKKTPNKIGPDKLVVEWIKEVK